MSNVVAHPGTIPVASTVHMQRGILVPTTFGELIEFAELAAQSGMVPKDYANKPGAIMIAVQMGSELGLTPTQALQSIAVINGRPGVWGDGLIGLCRGSPLCEDIIETIEGTGDARTATCIARRRNATACVGTFSVADAKKAGLFGKDIWLKYLDRMLQNRARGFALRDAFPDVLRGLKTVEELIDTPRDSFQGATIDHARANNTFSRKPAVHDVPEEPPTEPRIIGLLRDRLAQCSSEAEVVAVGNLKRVKAALDQAPQVVKDEINAMLSDAFDRVLNTGDGLDDQPEETTIDASALPASEPDFPGDRPL